MDKKRMRRVKLFEVITVLPIVVQINENYIARCIACINQEKLLAGKQHTSTFLPPCPHEAEMGEQKAQEH